MLPREREHIIQAIADTLQRVYGDATQTPLDRRAAAEVWMVLSSMGVAPLSTIAALIAGAGGEITVPENVLVDPPEQVFVFPDEFSTGAKRFAVRHYPIIRT